VGPYHPLHASNNRCNECDLRFIFDNVTMLPDEEKIPRLADPIEIGVNLLHPDPGEQPSDDCRSVHGHGSRVHEDVEHL
jgi:hypothetical protein